MTKHNKLHIASQLLLSAARDFQVATTDADYVKCILLAGAVVNICYPIVEEVGGTSSQQATAELATRLTEMRTGKPLDKKSRDAQVKRFIGFDAFVYNALKHAGDPRKDVAAIDDIFFEADLKREARSLILTAMDDFRSVPHAPSAIANFDPELLTLLNSPWPLGKPG
jgi:hypothetical protein